MNRNVVSSLLMLVIVVLFIFASSCAGPERKELLTEDQLNELKSLSQNKHYFDLRDTLQQYTDSDSHDLTFYRGLIENKFGRLESAIKQLTSFIDDATDSVNIELRIEAHSLLADSYFKAYRYKECAETNKTILAMFKNQLKQERIEDIENYLRICTPLRDVPPQTVMINEDTMLEPVGPGFLPLSINGNELQLAPDTGANLSIIIRSLAEEAGMKIINAAVIADNISGQKITVDIGIADHVELGGAVIKNAIFLVLEDEDLFFPSANFQISGAIGFPIFHGLGEVTFLKGGSLSFTSHQREDGEENMLIEELTPVITGHYGGRRHAFAIDTGATTSVLFPPFSEAYKDELNGKYPLTSKTLTGAGGSREIPAYILENETFTFGGAEATLQQIAALQEFTTDDSHYFFGNIGQDVIQQFEKMTINFRSMSITFE